MMMLLYLSTTSFLKDIQSQALNHDLAFSGKLFQKYLLQKKEKVFLNSDFVLALFVILLTPLLPLKMVSFLLTLSLGLLKPIFRVFILMHMVYAIRKTPRLSELFFRSNDSSSQFRICICWISIDFGWFWSLLPTWNNFNLIDWKFTI